MLLQILNFMALETLLVSIPETLGLLIFGIVLAGTAILMRKLLNRHDTAQNEEKSIKKV